MGESRQDIYIERIPGIFRREYALVHAFTEPKSNGNGSRLTSKTLSESELIGYLKSLEAHPFPIEISGSIPKELRKRNFSDVALETISFEYLRGLMRRAHLVEHSDFSWSNGKINYVEKE